MGFTNNSTDIKVTAKLTPYGRQKLLSGSSVNAIKKFGLGDSDANYYTSLPLTFGEVPNNGGDVGFGGTVSNSVHTNVNIKNKIYYNSSGKFFKNVELDSSKVMSELKFGNSMTITPTPDDFIILNNDEINLSKTNLFKSIYTPIVSDEKLLFTSVNDINGGFADTTYSGINQEKVLLINIKGSDYGEMINGCNVRVKLSLSGGSFELFSTFQKSSLPNSTQDTNVKEISVKSKNIGDNIVLLFSDEIQRPNNEVGKSWSTGFNSIKPFSTKSKELFNYKSNVNLSLTKDIMGGYILLDKGFIVITNQSIVNSFNLLSDTAEITFSSIYTEVNQEITCIVQRGEFSTSTNSTYTDGENIRLSEIGLYDENDSLMAIGKINKHLELANNQFMAISVKIIV